MTAPVHLASAMGQAVYLRGEPPSGLNWRNAARSWG